MIRHFKYHLLLAFILTAQILLPLHADEENVNPGINRYYENPDWQQWVNTFERPGREVYDHRHLIVEASEVRQGMVIADVGAGTGLFTRLFSKQVGPEGKIYAVDISPTFIKNIMAFSQKENIKNIEGIINTAKDVTLEPESIDLAFLTDTYHHFEYPASMLSSIHRALRPNGKMIIIDFVLNPSISSDWVMGHVRADKNTVVKEITEAGFQLVEEKPVLRHNYFLVFAKRK